MVVLRDVTESNTVTNEETRKIVDTPILYEKSFLVWVDITLYRMVKNRLIMPVLCSLVAGVDMDLKSSLPFVIIVGSSLAGECSKKLSSLI